MLSIESTIELVNEPQNELRIVSSLMTECNVLPIILLSTIRPKIW